MNGADSTHDASHDRFDPDLDAYQLLGTIPSEVVEQLWPGFAPQDLQVFINAVYVRRHMQSGPDYVHRVGAFARHAEQLPTIFSGAVVYSRYDKVAAGEAGVTVFAPVEEGDGRESLLPIGVRLYAAKQGGGKPNHVTTVMPTISNRRCRSMLRRTPHVCARDDEERSGPGPDWPKRVY